MPPGRHFHPNTLPSLKGLSEPVVVYLEVKLNEALFQTLFQAPFQTILWQAVQQASFTPQEQPPPVCFESACR